MKRFTFRLERLFTLRSYEEKQKEIELGKKVARCDHLRQEIEKRRKLYRESVLSPDRRTHTSDIIGLNQYLGKLLWEENNLRSQLSGAEDEQESARKVFLNASNKRKSLDNLKSARESDYYKNQRREEYKQLDELSIRAHHTNE